MALDINVVGSNLDANGNLKVALPKAHAQIGGVTMFCENDDGTVRGSAYLKSPEVSQEDAQESAILQELLHRIDAIGAAISQPQQQPVQVFVDSGNKATVKRSRAVKQDDGSWAMESYEEPFTQADEEFAE